MFEAPGWDELTRLEQRALVKLFGGGSLRKNDPAVVDGLRAKGSWTRTTHSPCLDCLFLTLAMRRQQADERLRTGLTS
jgi:hypothetical protein